MIRQFLCMLITIIGTLPLVAAACFLHFGSVHVQLDDARFTLPYEAIYFLLIPVVSTICFWAYTARTQIRRFRKPKIEAPAKAPPAPPVQPTQAIVRVVHPQPEAPPQPEPKASAVKPHKNRKTMTTGKRIIPKAVQPDVDEEAIAKLRVS